VTQAVLSNNVDQKVRETLWE